MSLAEKPLIAELGISETEMMYLASMQHHEGFAVLIKMFDAACRKATEEAILVDPESAEYDRILRFRQQRARVINEFCDAIRKSFNWYVARFDQIEKAKARSKPNAGTDTSN